MVTTRRPKEKQPEEDKLIEDKSHSVEDGGPETDENEQSDEDQNSDHTEGQQAPASESTNDRKDPRRSKRLSERTHDPRPGSSQGTYDDQLPRSHGSNDVFRVPEILIDGIKLNEDTKKDQHYYVVQWHPTVASEIKGKGDKAVVTIRQVKYDNSQWSKIMPFSEQGRAHVCWKDSDVWAKHVNKDLRNEYVEKLKAKEMEAGEAEAKDRAPKKTQPKKPVTNGAGTNERDVKE